MASRRQQWRFQLGVVVLCAFISTALALPVQTGTDVQDATSDTGILIARQDTGLQHGAPGTGDSGLNVNETYWAECGFDGDQDMYGLGIRIGYYVQWLATLFGAYYTPKIVSSAFEANAIFNIGMLAGLVYSTIAREDMYVVEPILVLGFSIGGAIVGLLDPKNVHDPKSLKSLRARLVHLCGTGALSVPLLIYWTWYSFYGMDTLTYNHCSTYTFFIVKINIWAPWFRYFMKVATIMSLVGIFGLAISVIMAYQKKSHENDNDRHQRHHPDRPRLSRSATALALRSRPTKSQFFIVIFVCAICALSVELGIKWNNITGINALGATGQLIPMAIGIITSVRVILGVIGEHLKSRTQRRKEAEAERFFGGGGEMLAVIPSRSGSRVFDPSDADQGKDEVLVLETLVKGGSGRGQLRRASTTSITLTEKPKISPSSTSDSQGTMSSSVGASSKSIRSMKSNKSGKLTKEKKEKGKEAEKGDSASSIALPREPGVAITRGTVSAPSVITVGPGRKKLQRDSNRRS